MLKNITQKQKKAGLIIILSVAAVIAFLMIYNNYEAGEDKAVDKMMNEEITETTTTTEVTTVVTTKITKAVTTTEAQTEESVTETEVVTVTLVETVPETEMRIMQEPEPEPVIDYVPRTKWTVQTASPNFNNAFSDILSNPEYVMPESHQINVNCVFQNPELPTGCEVTSLTTVLNYFGYAIGKMDMANNYLIKDKYGATDFSTAFIGNPQTTRGYGCYSPVIVNTTQRFLNDYGNMHSVVDLSGHELSDLFKVVSSDHPIVIWCTMSLVEPKEVYVWSLAGNIDVYWMQNEHCVVLTGYDLVEGTVTVSDPLKGIVKYNLQAFEQRYIQLGKQAVTIK